MNSVPSPRWNGCSRTSASGPRTHCQDFAQSIAEPAIGRFGFFNSRFGTAKTVAASRWNGIILARKDLQTYWTTPGSKWNDGEPSAAKPQPHDCMSEL